MSDHVITKGLDIPIKGAAAGSVVELPMPATVAYSPTEVRGLVAKPAVREGDSVKRGTPLFFHKTHRGLVFRSPAAGTVKEIRRGRRRVITDVIVECSGDESESFGAHTIDAIRAMSPEQALEAALASGMWAALQTRPLDKMADPAELPQAILISATETGPCQPGPEVLLDDADKDALQAAVELFRHLTSAVHVAVPAGSKPPALVGLDHVQWHSFAGPHPIGDSAVQVNLVTPPKGTGVVWTIRAWDAAMLGRAVLTGEFPAERIYAAVGAGVKVPRFVRTLLGAPLEHIVGEVQSGEHRWIRGSVLTGTAVDKGRWASMLKRAVHVLPEKVPQTILGWAMPMFGTWSFHRSFLAGVTGSRPAGGIDMRPGLWGGHRAIVPIGVYEKVVVTPDIMPQFLFKSIAAGDLEESIQLGMLDLTAEEAALCTYICPSKMEFDVLLREGLDMYEREA